MQSILVGSPISCGVHNLHTLWGDSNKHKESKIKELFERPGAAMDGAAFVIFSDVIADVDLETVESPGVQFANYLIKKKYKVSWTDALQNPNSKNYIRIWVVHSPRADRFDESAC